MPHDLLSDPRLADARDLFAAACSASRRWNATFAEALETYGDHGPDISGCGREHFPHEVKAQLRNLAGWVSLNSGLAYDARPKGFHRATMRRLARAVAARDGSGFYGPQA
jgi:hypothetical protein